MNWFKRLIGPKPFVPEPVIDERFVRTTLDELDLSSIYDRVMDAARPCVRFFRGSISDEPLETQDVSTAVLLICKQKPRGRSTTKRVCICLSYANSTLKKLRKR